MAYSGHYLELAQTEGVRMGIDKLMRDAQRNREAFDEVLPAYVSLKLTGVARALDRGARSAWLDASGCVWCVFDDPAFIRSGNGTDAHVETGEGEHGLQAFWSMGDVMMPGECDVAWVAERIAREAMLQLRRLGYHRRLQFREVEGERHRGVLFSRTFFGLR